MKYTDEELKIAPWLKNYGNVPFHLEYPDYSMCDAIIESAKDHPDLVALNFQDKDITYAQLVQNIKETEKALVAQGIKAGDVVTICMPNIPQAVYSIYAVNGIGAVASMIHPLSAIHEMVFYLKEVTSTAIITLDQFNHKIKKVAEMYELKHIIVASVSDALSPIKAFAYKLLKERKFEKLSDNPKAVNWKTFMKNAKTVDYDPTFKRTGKDLAIILFSGGTTGVSKGIELSNLNCNALALQVGTMCARPMKGKTMLAAMPVFHGFGLGICIHTMMVWGCKSVLIPKVSVEGYSTMLKTAKPNFIAGVPTLYEGILRNQKMEGLDLSFLDGVFSGGDSLSIELKKKLDKFLQEHGATVKVREGYGMTESVTTSCLTPDHIDKEGSVGFPVPDTYFAIFKPGTTEEVPYGTEGEICTRGPSVMMGYHNQEEETKNTLRVHEDGYTWLHSGDMGVIDQDGWLYFKQRIKRLIITSGYNVYPSHIENIIDAVEEVQLSCVIGVPDPYKMQKIKAFVQLMPGVTPGDDIKEKIFAHLKDRVAKYSMPYEIEFREQLPKTLVGKIAYTVLEKEEADKLAKAN